MKWDKSSNYIIAVFFSIAYVLVTWLNLIAPLHIPQINIEGPTFHPYISLVYLAISLAVTWSIYFFFKKPDKVSFFLPFIVGIALILIGLFLVSLATHYEDVILPLKRAHVT